MVTHKEYIKDIDGTAAFSVEGFDVQPGLDTTFPWLSAIARNYQQYKVRSCELVFRSTSADSVSAATNLGSVMLVHESDPSATAPNSKQDILTMAGVRDTKPSLSVKCPLDVHRRRTNAENTHYIRGDNGVPIGASKKEYDYGTFYVATQNCPANTIGELWIVYEIELLRPQQNDALQAGVELIMLNHSEVTGNYWFGQTQLDETLPTSTFVGADGTTYRVAGSNNYISDSRVASSNSWICFAGSDMRIGNLYELTINISDATANQDLTGTPTYYYGDNIVDPKVYRTSDVKGSQIVWKIVFRCGGLNPTGGNPIQSTFAFANCIMVQPGTEFDLTSCDCAYMQVRDITFMDPLLTLAGTATGPPSDSSLQDFLVGGAREGANNLLYSDIADV